MMLSQNQSQTPALRLGQRAALLGVAIVSIAASVACTKAEKEVSPIVAVHVAVAEKGPIRELVTAEAILFPIHQAAITPKVSAPIRTFMVNRGSAVKQGQLLAVLENADLTAAEVETKGSYEQAQAEYTRTTGAMLPEELQKAELDVQSSKQALDAEQKLFDSRKVLFDQGALPRKDLDQARVGLLQTRNQYQIAEQHFKALKSSGNQLQKKSAEGQLTAAKGHHMGAAAQLAYSEIRSPIDGVVTDRPLYPGEMASVGAPLLTVMDLSQIIAKAHIPQTEAVLLKAGDQATLQVSGAKGEAAVELPGKVTLVSPAADPNSTTIEVWVQVANPKRLLKPGMTARLSAVAQSVPDALIVPVSAVVTDGEGVSTVMVIGDDMHAHQTKVGVGIRQADMAQITSGIKAGDKVVTAGTFGLPDNTEVKVLENEAPAAEKPDAAKEGDAKPDASPDAKPATESH